MKAIIDTNFLLHCVQKKIQLFEHLEKEFSEVFVPRGVIDELIKISQEGGPRERVSAEVALKLLALSKAEILPLAGYVDQQIINYVYSKKGIVVATLDRRLQKVIGKKAKLLALRGRKFVVE